MFALESRRRDRGRVATEENAPSAKRTQSTSHKQAPPTDTLRNVGWRPRRKDGQSLDSMVGGPAWEGSVIRLGTLLRRGDPDARVDPAVKQVDGQVGDYHGGHDQHQDGLNDGQIPLSNGHSRQTAHARPGED